MGYIISAPTDDGLRSSHQADVATVEGTVFPSGQRQLGGLTNNFISDAHAQERRLVSASDLPKFTVLTRSTLCIGDNSVH